MHVTCTAGHDELRQPTLVEPPHNGGLRRRGGPCRDLVPERIGYDGLGNGHGRIRAGRMDGDHAEDPIGSLTGCQRPQSP